jgi:hypothetical protein
MPTNFKAKWGLHMKLFTDKKLYEKFVFNPTTKILMGFSIIKSA